MTERKERILIVDDDNANRQLISIILKLDGYELETASDGREALLKLKDQTYDLMLLDLMMPVLDGYQVLKMLRSDEQYKDLPVIIITAVSKRESVAHCIQLGANDYLLKPFDQHDVRNRVRKNIEQLRERALTRIVGPKPEAGNIWLELLTQRLLPSFIPMIFEPKQAELEESVLYTALTRFQAEAGIFFRMEPSGALMLVAMRNLPQSLAYGGTTGEMCPIRSIQATAQPGSEITREDQAVLAAVTTGMPVALDIASMRKQNHLFTMRFFQESHNFSPTYLLAAPIKDPSEKVLGILELINAHEPVNNQLIPFDANLQHVVVACCQVVAAAIIMQESA